MTAQTPEPATSADLLNDALMQFTDAVGSALDGVCSYGLTIGETYVPFDPDPEDECEEDEAQCNQAWVRVMSVTPVNVQENMEGSDCTYELSLDIEVGVLRCLDIPEDGEAPAAADMLVAATQSMIDMKTIVDTALCTPVWASINMGQWSPIGPLGGQYGGTWTFTVVSEDTGVV